MPLISVIVTTHNRPNLLIRALNSLLSQEFKDFEIILCADEAIIDTKEIAFKLLRVTDSFISVPNCKGPAGTRNLGISIASGKYICFLDDDDSYPSGYLLAASNFLTTTNQLHYFNYNEIMEDREDLQPNNDAMIQRDIGKFLIERLMISNFIPNNALFIPNHIANANQFDIRLQSHEDWDFLISLKSKDYAFKHHDIFGPNVHVSKGKSRNNDARISNSIGLDFLSIYRKWPSDSEAVRIARAETLKSLGVGMLPHFL